MAAVDILSDDDDDTARTPAAPNANPSFPPPAEVSGKQEKLVPEAGLMANVDILSDDDDNGDDKTAGGEVQAATQQPTKPEPPVAQAPNLSHTEVSHSEKPTIPVATSSPISNIEVGKNGLRSVVVASLDLVDSDDEGDQAMVGKAPSGPPLAEAHVPTAGHSMSDSKVEDDSEDDMIAPAAPQVLKSVADTSTAGNQPAVPDQADSEDEMLSGPGALQPPGQTGQNDVNDKKRGLPPQTVQPLAKKAKDAQSESKESKDKKKKHPSQMAQPATNDEQLEATDAIDKSQSQPSEVVQPPAKKAKDGQNEAKESKDKKLTKDEMESKVLQYMQQQNRPYNAQNVFDNLHGSVPKGQVQQLLDSLVVNGHVVVKEFGKSKVYLISQSSVVGGADGMEDETKSLQSELDVAASKAQEMRSVVEETKREIAALRSHRTLLEEVASLQREAPTLEGRVAELRAAAEEADKDNADVACTLGEQDINTIEATCRDVHAEWRRRKRLCMEIIHRFSEMSGMKVAKLIEKYGIETDEDSSQPFPECMK